MRAFARVVVGILVAALGAGAVLVLFATVANGAPLAGTLVEALRLVLFAALSTLLLLIPLGLPLAFAGYLLGITSVRPHLLAGAVISVAALALQIVGEPGQGETIVNLIGIAAYLGAGLIGGALYWLAGVADREKSR